MTNHTIEFCNGTIVGGPDSTPNLYHRTIWELAPYVVTSISSLKHRRGWTRTPHPVGTQDPGGTPGSQHQCNQRIRAAAKIVYYPFLGATPNANPIGVFYSWGRTQGKAEHSDFDPSRLEQNTDPGGKGWRLQPNRMRQPKVKLYIVYRSHIRYGGGGRIQSRASRWAPSVWWGITTFKSWTWWFWRENILCCNGKKKMVLQHNFIIVLYMTHYSWMNYIFKMPNTTQPLWYITTIPYGW